WKGRMWAQVLPHITVRADLVVRAQGFTGWAIRKGSPQLQAAIRDFYGNYDQKQGGLASRLAQYHKGVKQIANNSGAAWARFQHPIALFEKYGRRYGFDPLLLAAQGYQESQLRQEARSRGGAIGVMQLLPATGRALQVGDIRVLEPNIHAGAKYLDELLTRSVPDVQFSAQNRALFAFAAYNTGPANLAKMRTAARARGLDPDQWFNHVEVVAAAKIGIEPTTYVRNIYKYYVAYKLMQDAQAAQHQARAQAHHATAEPPTRHATEGHHSPAVKTDRRSQKLRAMMALPCCAPWLIGGAHSCNHAGVKGATPPWEAPDHRPAGPDCAPGALHC